MTDDYVTGAQMQYITVHLESAPVWEFSEHLPRPATPVFSAYESGQLLHPCL